VYCPEGFSPEPENLFPSLHWAVTGSAQGMGCEKQETEAMTMVANSGRENVSFIRIIFHKEKN
jgi:hypothetical protein